jgi:class 3 adenylate cyclase
VREAEPMTLERIRTLHPWDADVDPSRALEWLWHFDLDAAPSDLWDQVIDTSRFNRALGLARMEFVEREGVLHGTGVNGGFRQNWVELPWDWVAERYLVSQRVYSKGFAHRVRVIYRMQRLDADRTRFWVYFGWVPRSWFGKFCIKLGMPSIERGYRKVLGELVDALDGRAPGPYQWPPPALSPAAQARVASLERQLIDQKLPEEAVHRLVKYAATADDMNAYRIQLRRLAHTWGLEDDDVLRTALHATRVGLLDMSWDVICPHCRGVREEIKNLGDVPERGECSVCDIDFETDSENAIEITFHVHPSIRDVPKVYFCSAEPSTKRHISMQQRVAPGESVAIESSVIAGRYRLRLKGTREYGDLQVSDEGAEDAIEWSASRLPTELRVGRLPAARLTNDTDEPHTFVIEEVAWADEALRPVHLFNFQEFRDLFSDEYVAADVQLSVGEQTILFTDIVGSTRFYSDRGDPAAFMEVKRHFTEMYEVVRQYHGAVVKTIGDACMASFSSPVDALRASRDIHARFHEHRRDSPIRVRISLNTGPCIAVRLNSNIDYFGTTVNLAAKLQATCEGGEISMSDATYRSPHVATFLAEEGADLEELSFEAKALGQTIAVQRWNIWRQAATATQSAAK